MPARSGRCQRVGRSIADALDTQGTESGPGYEGDDESEQAS